MFGTGTVEGCPFGNCFLMSDMAIRGGMDLFVCCIMAWKIAGCDFTSMTASSVHDILGCRGIRRSGSGNKDNILT